MTEMRATSAPFDPDISEAATGTVQAFCSRMSVEPRLAAAAVLSRISNDEQEGTPL